MATTPLDVQSVPKGVDKVQDPSCELAVWLGMAANDVGAAYDVPGRADRSVQVVDVAGGSIFIEGSNDGTNFSTLTDPQGNDLEFSADGLKQVSEVTIKIRPRAGAGVTDGSVYLLARRPIR